MPDAPIPLGTPDHRLRESPSRIKPFWLAGGSMLAGWVVFVAHAVALGNWRLLVCGLPLLLLGVPAIASRRPVFGWLGFASLGALLLLGFLWCLGFATPALAHAQPAAASRNLDLLTEQPVTSILILAELSLLPFAFMITTSFVQP